MLSRLSISGRIYGAFGVMILLLAMLLLVSMVGVQALSGTFSGYRDHVGQSGQINRVVEQLGRTRLAFSNYNLTPGADNATRVSAELSALDTANRAFAAAGNADIAALGDNLSAYAGDVGAMIALDADLAVLKAEIETAGTAATDTLAAMIAAAAQSSSLNAKAAAVSGLAMQRLLQLRLAVNAMIQTPSPANHATSLTLAGQAQQTLGELRAIFFKAEDVAQVDAVTALLGLYTRSIDAVHDRLEQRLQLGEVIGQIDVQLALAYDGLMQAATEAQTALGAAGDVQASQIRLTALAAGAVALVVGLVFAVLIARWLSGSIRQMSGAVGRMAQGDFDVTMAGADQHNELGQIARSLEVFGANGRAVRDNEVQREADRARAAQRQALRDRLQVDVEGVVAAALDGDFGRRIEARYGIADLDSFAGSVNALVATMARGLDETGAVLAALADGDLSRRVTGTYAGAFGRLKSDTNSMADGLSLTMTRLGQSSRALKLATGEILSGANDLSARTHRQAAAIEQTAAAIQKLSGTIIENADRASEVASRTAQTSAIADEGGQVMVNATAAMERISTSSAKISNIIGLIDDIAFQTNLLALNASVEAARAGDAGKGFAVVAVEVRRLAQSAANASADVKLLIEQSSREVSGGTRLVGDAAAKLAAIVVSVEHNAALIQAISTSSQTQSAAVKAVAQSMRQMDEMTQSNAALVEQTNLSIGQTEAQAIELDGIVNAFSLGPDLADQRLRA